MKVRGGRALQWIRLRLSVALRWLRTAYAWAELRVVLTVGLVALGALTAGLCGIALWAFPAVPAWAVRSIIVGTAVAVTTLGLRQVREIAVHGMLGLKTKGAAQPKKGSGSL